jgi:hypothetical protein
MLVPGGIAPLVYGIRNLTKRPSREVVAKPIPAALSGTVQTAMYASGGVLLSFGVLSGLLWLGDAPGASRGGFPRVPIYAVWYSLLVGVGLLSMPRQIQQQRDKRMKEHKASAPRGAPPPAELPRPPDSVFLSTMFGVLAMFSVAVVFGPAAIVCGIVAVTEGHLKGLIGTTLGLVGLIVWGLVFVYFLQG